MCKDTLNNIYTVYIYQVNGWAWRENKGRGRAQNTGKLLTLVSQGKVMAHSEYIYTPFWCPDRASFVLLWCSVGRCGCVSGGCEGADLWHHAPEVAGANCDNLVFWENGVCPESPREQGTCQCPQRMALLPWLLYFGWEWQLS